MLYRDLITLMNLSMTGEVAAAYKSGSQRARVVTEFWGEHNLYCPNCSSPKLNRLSHNTKASDFSCPSCEFKYQLKGQKTHFGKSITDGAYEAMMNAIRNDETPNFYFMQYDLATWSVKNLLLIPTFAFPPSAIIKRNPLSATARRAGWIGCNIALHRIPIEARIAVVTENRAAPASEVREKFKRVKPLKDISVKQRGWTLDVLNIVRRLDKLEFTNEDVYACERELEALHPDNRHPPSSIMAGRHPGQDSAATASPSAFISFRRDEPRCGPFNSRWPWRMETAVTMSNPARIDFTT